MTIQEYYALQAALQSLDTQVEVITDRLEEVRDVFNKIDVNLLGVGTVAPQPIPTNSNIPLSPMTTGNVNIPNPITQPKVRKKLNTPVIIGPLGDVVNDILAEKEQAAQEAKGPVRNAPYEVEVKSTSITPGGEYVARVEDSNKMEAYVPIGQETYEEFNKDPNGLMIDLNKETLAKTEWLPIEESNASIVTTSVTTEV